MIIKQTGTILIQREMTSLDEDPVFSMTSFASDKNINYFYVVHETRYKYTAPISNSKHLFRLQPVHDLEQSILSYRLSISANASQVCNFTGVFGNHASFVEIKEPYSELSFLSQGVIAVSETSKQLNLVHQPRTMPLIWMPWDQVMLQAYLQAPELPESELFELSEYAMSFVKKNNNDVFAVLQDINKTIFREFSYVPGSTTSYTTAYDVLVNRRGVCQDFSNLLICLARLLNVPARYRMGYIYTGGHYDNQAQADATHAWVEVYLPYLGWIGLDPTNGCEAGKNHIRTACGRHYKDATPTSGTVFSAEPGTQESLTTSVKVLLLNTPSPKA